MNEKEILDKLKELETRIDDLEMGLDEVKDTAESHQHDSDNFPTKNY